MAQLQITGHPLPPQIQIAIAQPHLFAGLFRFFPGDGKRDLTANPIEDLDLLGIDFHLSGGQAWVQRFIRSPLHQTLDPDHILIAHVFGSGVGVWGLLRIADQLHHPSPIPQIQKDHPSMIAATVNPTVKNHRLVDMFGSQGSAVMGALSHVREVLEN